MASVSDLADCASELAAMAEALAAELRGDAVCGDVPNGVDGVEGPDHIYDARRTALLGVLHRIQAILRQPNDFLRGLALHVRIFLFPLVLRPSRLPRSTCSSSSPQFGASLRPPRLL